MYKIALTTLARNENVYLKEWIDHYRKIGVDHFFIGDNNDPDGEDISELITTLGYQDFVTVVDAKNKLTDRQQNISVQQQFFTDAYHKFGNEYDYMCFFDVDEFLEITMDEIEPNIKEFIGMSVNNCLNSCGQFPQQIMVGWLMYDDNDKLFYENKPVQERFTRVSEQIYYGNFHRNVSCGKSIVKCGIPNVAFDMSMHFANIKDGDILTCFNEGYNWSKCTSELFPFTRIDAVLKHYYSKSLEEFIKRRIVDKSSYTHISIEKIKHDYYAINKITPEKEKTFELYIKNLLPGVSCYF